MRQRGRRLSDAYFTLSVLANAETHARLGLSIATRAVGNAVARNLVKRIAREAFRVNQHQLPAVDILVTAREAARRASPATLRAALDQQLRKIRERG